MDAVRAKVKSKKQSINNSNKSIIENVANFNYKENKESNVAKILDY